MRQLHPHLHRTLAWWAHGKGAALGQGTVLMKLCAPHSQTWLVTFTPCSTCSLPSCSPLVQPSASSVLATVT